MLGARGYLRYVDDFALFHDDVDVLAEWHHQIAGYLAGRRLSLHPVKTTIVATDQPAAFLGYVLLPGGRRRLPDDNVGWFRNRLCGLRDRWRAGSVGRVEVEQRIGSWIAHAENADTWRLRAAIFRDGWFDPVPAPDGPSSGSLAGPLSSCSPRRFLEQQTKESAGREPQQERHRKPQQQQRFPSGQHASMPEPSAPRGGRERRGCVQDRS